MIGRVFATHVAAVEDREQFIYDNKLDVLSVNDKRQTVELRSGNTVVWLVYRSELDEPKIRSIDLEEVYIDPSVNKDHVRYIKSRVGVNY